MRFIKNSFKEFKSIFTSENIIRIFGIIVCICWLIYAIIYHSYAAIFFQVVMLVDIVISLLNNLSIKTASK